MPWKYYYLPFDSDTFLGFSNLCFETGPLSSFAFLADTRFINSLEKLEANVKIYHEPLIEQK